MILRCSVWSTKDPPRHIPLELPKIWRYNVFVEKYDPADAGSLINTKIIGGICF